MNGRIFRNGVTSQCTEEDKPQPGVFNDQQEYFYIELGPYGGETETDTCVTIDWNYGDCIIPFGNGDNDITVHPSIYSSFDVNDPASGFLADNGDSAFDFSFNLPAGETFVMVVQQVFSDASLSLGCSFEFCIDLGDCT
jgi:hypothetical protein